MSRAWRIEYKGALYHVLSRDNERSDIFIDEDDGGGFSSDKHLRGFMQKDDDNSKDDVPEDGIAGVIKTDEPKERKHGELERCNRAGGDLAGVIRQEAAGPAEVTFDRTIAKATDALDNVLVAHGQSPWTLSCFFST